MSALERIGVLAGATVLFAGLLLVRDQPGLRGSYYLLERPWEGRPVASATTSPHLEHASDLDSVLSSRVGVGVRWDGWWHVERPGVHTFGLDTDNGGYLRIDGRDVLDTRGRSSLASRLSRIELEPGFHAVEAGFFEGIGEARFRIYWIPPGEEARSARFLPQTSLYPARPLRPRRWIRGLLDGWPVPARRTLGLTLVALASVSLLSLGRRSALREKLGAFAGKIRSASGAWVVLAIFFATFAFSLPFAGTLRAGDDSLYLAAAVFDERAWFVGRYAHVYLLKAFTALAGDPFLGVRLWWSFTLAVTVASMAAAVRALVSKGRGRVFSAALCCLLSQTVLFGRAGAAFADNSAMAWITLAVALFLGDRESADPPASTGWDWRSLLTGAVSIIALRSKEVAAILLLIPLSWGIVAVLSGGWRRLRAVGRRWLFWTAGATLATALLLCLAARFQGDPLFGFRADELGASRQMNFPERVRTRSTSWPETILEDPARAAFWIGVCLAAIAAGSSRRSLSLRLFHLLPIAYLLALVALYVRMPHPFSPRMLIPILPVGSLCIARMLDDLGLGKLRWRDIRQWTFVLPFAVVLGGLWWGLLPALRHSLGLVPWAAEGQRFDQLALEVAARYGWTPKSLTLGVLIPGLFLLWIVSLGLAGSRRKLRALLVCAGVAIPLGIGIQDSLDKLRSRRGVQMGVMLEYPWRTFRDELNAAGAQNVFVSPDLIQPYGFAGQVRPKVARLILGRENVAVTVTSDPPVEWDAAIVSRWTFLEWEKQVPGLSEVATLDPFGLLVLLDRSRRGRALAPSSGPMPLAERFSQLRAGADSSRASEVALKTGSGSHRMASFLANE